VPAGSHATEIYADAELQPVDALGFLLNRKQMAEVSPDSRCIPAPHWCAALKSLPLNPCLQENALSNSATLPTLAEPRTRNLAN
jgi:hypothetical protein